ncbi:MAG: molecular chaperone TorD family protein [Eggerthellaceae bacterium]|jgi:TorA maturation chaperone TorD|nr:molecular chaperone TorD family protein [Eggerthellaceae bacterium]
MDSQSSTNDTGHALMQRLVTVNEWRARIYEFIARLLDREIDEDFMNVLSGMSMPQSSGNDKVDRGYTLIMHYLDDAPEDAIDELSADYERIFLGESQSHAVSLFEHTYANEKHPTLAQACETMLDFYERFDFVLHDEERANADRLPIELQFIQMLAQRGAHAISTGDMHTAAGFLAEQNTCIEDHLALWVPRVSADIEMQAETDLYKGVASLLDGYLAVEKTFFSTILGSQDI